MATSPKFTLLSTRHLATQPPSSETTLQNLIDTSEAMAEEAREVLPYSFDECTYSKGYLRQAIWSCLDCGGKGVCYGCSISCHAEHRLVELWTKRHFRCDCPTSPETHSQTSNTTAPLGKRRRCNLNPPHAQPQLPNDENRYTHNFQGEFCRCGRSYDPETEEEAMLSCMGCEDWYHESCLNLRPSVSSISSTSVVKEDTTGIGDDNEDEDEEARVLIPSDSYDGLICAKCVESSTIVKARAGTEGWMTIEPGEATDQWTVKGRPQKHHGEAKPGDQEEKTYGVLRERHDDGVEGEDAGSYATGSKRPRSDDEALLELEKKKSRIDVASGLELPDTHVAGNSGESSSRTGAGDVFLAYGIRDQLRKELDSKSIASLPFPLDDEEVYEPPQDTEQEETLDQVTSRVMGNLPRVQAIEAIHGYQSMKDKLVTMLRGHAQTGQAVSKADIDGFFADLRQHRAAA